MLALLRRDAGAKMLAAAGRRGSATVGLKKSGFIHLEPGEKVLFFTNLIPAQRARFDYRYKMVRGGQEFMEDLIKQHCIPRWMLEPGDGAPEGGVEGDQALAKAMETYRKARKIDITGTIPRPKDGGVFVKYRLQNPPKKKSTRVHVAQEANPTDGELGAETTGGEQGEAEAESDSSRVERDQNPYRSDAEQRQNEIIAKEIAAFLTNVKRSKNPLWVDYFLWRTTKPDFSPQAFRRWFLPRRTKVFAVLGSPWLEDLNRFPTRRLNVVFNEGHKHLTQQAVYALCRQYGKIAEIVTRDPKPGSSQPGSASVRFATLDGAVAARNCLDGYWVPELKDIHGKEKGVRLSILYERASRRRWIKEMFLEYSKVTMPVLIFLVTFIVLTLFEPVRVWFIKLKITGYEDLLERTIFFWRKPEYSSEPPPIDIRLDDAERAALEKLNVYLKQSQERSIVIVGHQRNKRELITQHLRNRKNVLVVDCEPIVEAVDEVKTIQAAAEQVGYYPVFSTINLLSDLAIQAALGPTTNALRQPLEMRLREIMLHAKAAIRQVALRDKPADMTDDEYLKQNPDARPVLIIDNFLHQEHNSLIYEKLADCASELIRDLYCHVIFLTTDTSFAKSLPNPLFRQIAMTCAQHPNPALSDSASQAWGLYIQPRSAAKNLWTPEQAWFLIAALAENDTLKYDEVLLDDLFKEAGERALQHLEREALITVHSELGRPSTITPGRQVKREDLVQLVGVHRLRLMMELRILKKRARMEKERIGRKEEELRMLAGLGVRPKERERYLVEKIERSHRRIEEWERRIRRCREELEVEKGCEKEERGRRWGGLGRLWWR